MFILPLLSAVGVEMIYYAPESVLSSMALSRGLDTSGTADEIRERLYDYYGYVKTDILEDSPGKKGEEEPQTDVSVEPRNAESTESTYVLQINSANSVTGSDSVFTIEGNVIIDFLQGDNDKKTLSATKVVVDTSRKIITALGNAKYVDSASDAAIKEIEADILTVAWEEGDIYITDGTTTTERQNSEKKKVTFSTSGERLSYLSEGAIIFDEGYITSNPKTAYSSISASSIMILPGEDMFLSNATFNIGRVPIFYLPFFFFPGSKILGNPSFGFDSDKGAFLNTSFEIFGTYPKIESSDESSSFSSLLKSAEDNSDKERNGYYYQDTDTLTGIEKFAKDTSSYLVLLFDTYQGGSSAKMLSNGGVHLGVDSAINLFNNKLKINVFTGIATPQSTTDKAIRYYGNNSLSFSSSGLSLSLKVPYYSDRTVLYHYGNRLTGFSYGPLMGGTSEFPDDYSSGGISSYTQSFSLTYSLPSSVKIPFVSSLSLKNLSLDRTFSIRSSSSSNEKNAVLTSYSLPSLSVSLSGNILSLEMKKKTADKTSTAENNTGKDADVSLTEEEKEILLSDLYRKDNSVTTVSSSTASKVNLSYTVTEDFSNKVNNNSTTEEKSDEKLSSVTYSKVSMEGNVGSLVNVSNVFTNTMTYSFTNNYSTSAWSKKLTFNPLNTLKVTVPYIGVTYNLSFKPFDYTDEESDTQSKTVTSNNFAFTKDFVKTHSLVFSKTLKTDSYGSFTGDVTYILFPLDGTVTPSLKWSKSGFSLSLSWLFKIENEKFNKDVVKLGLSYSSTYFTTSSSLSYQTKDLESVTDYFDPFSMESSVRLQNKDKNYYIEETVNGDGTTEGFVSELKTTVKLNEITGTVTHKRDSITNDIELDSINIQSNIKGKSFQLWKGRFYLSFGLDSTLFINTQSRDKSYLTFSPNIILSVAEFMDIKFSFKTQNSKFTSYYDDDSFSFPLFWNDLVRSLDFVGDGRSNTNFIMQSASLEVVHYMEDWNLNFKYTTSFVKGSDNNKTVYSLQPSFSIYLSWNTMPDLKAEENWKRDASGKWTRQ